MNIQAKQRLTSASCTVEGEDTYKFTNGKAPSGNGSWIFAPVKTLDFHKSPTPQNGKDYFTSAHGTPYATAKKQAAKWGEEHGHYTMYIQT